MSRLARRGGVAARRARLSPRPQSMFRSHSSLNVTGGGANRGFGRTLSDRGQANGGLRRFRTWCRLWIGPGRAVGGARALERRFASPGMTSRKNRASASATAGLCPAPNHHPARAPRQTGAPARSRPPHGAKPSRRCRSASRWRRRGGSGCRPGREPRSRSRGPRRRTRATSRRAREAWRPWNRHGARSDRRPPRR